MTKEPATPPGRHRIEGRYVNLRTPRSLLRTIGVSSVALLLIVGGALGADRLIGSTDPSRDTTIDSVPQADESAEPSESPEADESAEPSESPEETADDGQGEDADESAEPSESPDDVETAEPSESPEAEETAEPSESPDDGGGEPGSSESPEPNDD